MSAEIVNLRQARKARTRADKERQAAESRAVHGRTKAQKQREALEKERTRREIDGAHRGSGPDKGSDDRQ